MKEKKLHRIWQRLKEYKQNIWKGCLLFILAGLTIIIVFHSGSGSFHEGSVTQTGDFTNPKTGDVNITDNCGEYLMEYEVKEGDNFESIWRNNIVSYHFNIAKDKVMSANKINNIDNIKVGQILYIPVRYDCNYRKYIVKNGDTINKIAKRCAVNNNSEEVINLIISKNGKDNIIDLDEGQTLLIP